MFFDEDYLNYMGFRRSLCDDAVEECLEAAKNGDSEHTVNGDFTDDEAEYIREQVRKKLR